MGAGSAVVDSSWGTTFDANRDGFADLVVGATNANSTGRAYIYLGGPTGLATTPAVTLTGPDGTSGRFGGRVASAGDVNGDGFADLIVGADCAIYASSTCGSGRVYLFLGGETGVAATPLATLIGLDGDGGHFGDSVASAGDVNGDGFADVVVGAYGVAANAGRAYVYTGRATDFATTPPVVLTAPDGVGGYFGRVAGAGDVNGDGFADVVIGAPDVTSNTGRAYVYLGSATGLETTPTTMLVGLDGTNGLFGVAVNADDVNGDGFADVIVGAQGAMSSAGRAYVYLGSATGLGSTSSSMIAGPDGANGRFGGSLASAGDVNGDGFADVIVGADGVTSNTGRAYVYLGSATGLGTVPAATLTTTDGPGGRFGAAVAGSGDVDADGFGEVVVGAWGVSASAGRSYMFFGSSTGTTTSRTVMLIAPDGGNFGTSVY